MSRPYLARLWAKYEELDRLASDAEDRGDDVALERQRGLLAQCAQLIAECGDNDGEE
jgi:hypothetical protein